MADAATEAVIGLSQGDFAQNALHTPIDPLLRLRDDTRRVRAPHRHCSNAEQQSDQVHQTRPPTMPRGVPESPAKAKRDRKLLRRRPEGESAAFEELVSELSAAFARAPEDEIDSEINRWLKRIVLALNLDRSTIARIDNKSDTAIVTHRWGRKGLRQLPMNRDMSPILPWYKNRIQAGETIVYSTISELPREYARDLKKGRPFLPKSHVGIPLKLGEQIVGVVGFGTLRSERSWPPKMVRRLQLITEIFGNALERSRAATERASLRNQLAHVSRAATMGQLAAAVTHELNQPLAAILNNAEAIQSLLSESSPDLDEVRDAIADIIEDTTRASEIIRRLRAFFRRDEPSRMPLDVGNLVTELARVVRSDALIRQISFRLDVSGPLPPIAGDRIQLQQSILNLILNAFDAVSEVDGAREVAVEVSAIQSSTVRVLVRDSGKGITAVALPNIFEPFFTTKPNGMGMGLAISRSIIEGHRGKLAASSNSHRGSVFEITLPALAQSTG